MKALGAILALLGIATIAFGAFHYFNNLLISNLPHMTVYVVGSGLLLLVVGGILANRGGEPSRE